MTLRLYFALLGLLAIERIFELALSRRNARWALSEGAVELCGEHFGYMKLLHVGFFVGCAAEVWFLRRPFIPELGFVMLGLAGLAQALRIWTILSLGKRWNVRVLVVPGMPAVTSGPYRFVRHPNYLAVILEGFAIPLVHTALLTAIIFSVLNAWMLRVRIRCEEDALDRYARYGELLGDRARFLPTRLSLMEPR